MAETLSFKPTRLWPPSWRSVISSVTTCPSDELVVVRQFGEPIHPGLTQVGSVKRGGDKPFHTVINGENYHVLKALTYTHQGKVDAINKYIGKVPVYVSGDSITDFEMLQIASRMQMVINPKDKNAPEDNIFLQATQRGWPIQRW